MHSDIVDIYYNDNYTFSTRYDTFRCLGHIPSHPMIEIFPHTGEKQTSQIGLQTIAKNFFDRKDLLNWFESTTGYDSGFLAFGFVFGEHGATVRAEIMKPCLNAKYRSIRRSPEPTVVITAATLDGSRDESFCFYVGARAIDFHTDIIKSISNRTDHKLKEQLSGFQQFIVWIAVDLEIFNVTCVNLE